MRRDRVLEIVARARERWPGLLESKVLAEGIPSSGAKVSIDALDREAEYYLTRACGDGDRAAIEAFEKAFFAEVRTSYARLRPRGLGLDELEQRIREKLFAKKIILTYSGTGDLRRWLRVLSTRIILDHVRSLQPEMPLEDQFLPADSRQNSEFLMIKAQFRINIRAALEEALCAVTDRQRFLLRNELSGVSLAALAESFQVHVRSVRRWVQKANESFLGEFRAALAKRLKVAPGEMNSILEAARSQLLSALGDVVGVLEPSSIARNKA